MAIGLSVATAIIGVGIGIYGIVDGVQTKNATAARMRKAEHRAKCNVAATARKDMSTAIARSMGTTHMRIDANLLHDRMESDEKSGGPDKGTYVVARSRAAREADKRRGRGNGNPFKATK